MDVFGYAPRLPAAGETVLGTRLAYAPGGKGANQAVAARRMGAEVSFTGACGRDTFGDAVTAALRADGIDVTGLRRLETETGVAMIVVDDRGENQIVALPGRQRRGHRPGASGRPGRVGDAGRDPGGRGRGGARRRA